MTGSASPHDPAAAHRLLAELAAIVHSTDDAILAKTLDGRIISWNPSAERMYGYSAEEAIGQSISILLPPDRAGEVEEILERLRLGEVVYRFETKRLTKDGRILDVSVTISPICDETGVVIGASTIARDVTELKRAAADRARLESELRQAHKLEAVGRLAGGIAHDFNNLLTVIGGFSRLLRKELEPGAPQASYAAEIERAADRGSALVQQMLSFSRRQADQPELLDLNELITDSKSMVRRLAGENVQLITSLSSPLRAIRADRGQMLQVLLNLAANARDAMPGGGTLRIETANVDIGDEPEEQPAAVPGRYVLLAVIDTGTGMDEETQSHAFEPFFTTKPLGGGTGLGLSSVYGIVEQTGGAVELESEPTWGTSVRIFLPQATSAQGEPNVVPSDVESRGTILVAEDDDPVRALITLILADAGFRVLEAASGAEALELASSYESEIDVLMTDVIMPGMTGVELAERLSDVRPSLVVLYTTGYAEESLSDRAGLPSGRNVMRKPFQPEELVDLVGDLLRRRPADAPR